MKSSTKTKKDKLAQAVVEADWEFRDSDTKELTHELHRYSGKYIPQIARQAMELISEPGELILDPYVGSGTTLLEANLINRNSIGIDLNPLAVSISKVKTTPIEDEKLNIFLKHFENIADALITSRKGQQFLLGEQTSLLREEAINDSRFKNIWFQKWFNPKILEDLLVLDYHISKYDDESLSALGRISLSNILRRSSNAHSGYPNVMFDKNKNNQSSPAVYFLKELNENISKVKELNKKFNKKIETSVVQGDATNLPIENDSVDAVVTHPPYIGSVPYAEYGLLSLKWLGFDPKELDQKLTGGKRQTADVVTRFTDSYKKMLSESFRVLKNGRHIFLLVGDPTVKGEVVDLAQMTKELAEEVGFRFVVEKKRNGVNRRANKMGAETLLFLKKD